MRFIQCWAGTGASNCAGGKNLNLALAFGSRVPKITSQSYPEHQLLAMALDWH